MKIFPPRPENAIDPRLIAYYERKNWVAQIKKNGTCTTIVVNDEGEAEFYTREGAKHKAWKPTVEIEYFFREHKNSIFVAELLHNKHPSVKNTLYIFDILKYRGIDMVEKDFTKRQNVLKSVVRPNHFIWIAKNHTAGLTELFNRLDDPIDEGIVLKDPKSVLKPCGRKTSNSGWQVKCRVPHKNYGF